MYNKHLLIEIFGFISIIIIAVNTTESNLDLKDERLSISGHDIWDLKLLAIV